MFFHGLRLGMFFLYEFFSYVTTFFLGWDVLSLGLCSCAKIPSVMLSSVFAALRNTLGKDCCLYVSISRRFRINTPCESGLRTSRSVGGGGDIPHDLSAPYRAGKLECLKRQGACVTYLGQPLKVK